MTQRRDLYLIFKEAVNNLVKYSGATEALVQISVMDSQLNMLISDNGKGFDRTSLRAGNGLHNMEQRAGSAGIQVSVCPLYTSPSPRDRTRTRMPPSAFKKKPANHHALTHTLYSDHDLKPHH